MDRAVQKATPFLLCRIAAAWFVRRRTTPDGLESTLLCTKLLAPTEPTPCGATPTLKRRMNALRAAYMGGVYWGIASEQIRKKLAARHNVSVGELNNMLMAEAEGPQCETLGTMLGPT
jgi:hypothetical protein